MKITTLLPKNYFKTILIFVLFLFSASIHAQNPKGKLFIIGGGHRSDTLMTHLINISDLKNAFYKLIKDICDQNKTPLNCQRTNPYFGFREI